MVTGHSLGGGLAQMFTMALNSNADLLKAGFTADSLYTYGAMPVSAVGTKNDQAADGCFSGPLLQRGEQHQHCASGHCQGTASWSSSPAADQVHQEGSPVQL